MKTTTMIIGAVLGILAMRAMARAKAAANVNAGIPVRNTTDWVGSMWERLAGRDLVAPGAPNIGGTAQADPGRIGLAGAGIMAGWNGSVGA